LRKAIPAAAVLAKLSLERPGIFSIASALAGVAPRMHERASRGGEVGSLDLLSIKLTNPRASAARKENVMPGRKSSLGWKAVVGALAFTTWCGVVAAQRLATITRAAGYARP